MNCMGIFLNSLHDSCSRHVCSLLQSIDKMQFGEPGPFIKSDDTGNYETYLSTFQQQKGPRIYIYTYIYIYIYIGIAFFVSNQY